MTGITTKGLYVCAAAMGGSVAYPTYTAIGMGSTAFASGDTTLVTEFDRNLIDTYDLTTAEQITYISNWSPTEISGCILAEVGVFNADTGGAMSSRHVLTGSLFFDGEQELQVQNIYTFLI